MRLYLAAIGLLMLFALVSGCSSSKPKSDPLAGWHTCDHVPQSVKADLQNYLDSLSQYQRDHIVFTDLYELDGQYAVRLTLALNGSDWNYILVYDKTNKRIKITRFITNSYAS
jgi:hypothetical protein